MPPCRQCEGAGVTCYGKMRGPVLAVEDRMQHGGSKEKEGERNGGDKGETEQKRKQNRDGGDRQENRGHGGHGGGDEEDSGQS